MRTGRARRSVALLALASVLVAPMLPALAAAWLLSHHAHGHAHAVSLEADAGHFDLVLSHDEAAPHDHTNEPIHADHAEPSPAGDHVVHLGSAHATWQTARRVAPDGAPVLPRAFELPVVVASRVPEFAAASPRAPDPSLLRTVVLRL